MSAADFVSLADLLRAPLTTAAQPALEEPVEHAAAPAETPAEIVAALREAKRFRARLADAFDDAAARVLRELATEVLARELRLAPCDLSALVERVRERIPVVRVRVAPEDAPRVRCLPVLADPALHAGDAIVELSGGAVDARLGVRLAAVLAVFA